METRSPKFNMFPSIILLSLSKKSTMLIFSTFSFSMVVFKKFHPSSNNFNVVAMVFVYNKFILKETFSLSCGVKIDIFFFPILTPFLYLIFILFNEF